MTEAEILAEATRLATTALYTSAAEAEIADALRKAATVDVIARMPRCNTCRHWQVYTVALSGVRGSCQKIALVSTAPDFGCVRHEANA